MASAFRAEKFAESQVWIDKELYRHIEAFNLRCGKSVPTKHVVNAILRMFMDEHKTEIQKAVKRHDGNILSFHNKCLFCQEEAFIVALIDVQIDHQTAKR
jgi:hypothetical protein